MKKSNLSESQIIKIFRHRKAGVRYQTFVGSMG